MDAKRILKFLRQLMANNNRQWFQDHKQEYEAVRADFEQGVQQALDRIARCLKLTRNHTNNTVVS